MIDTSNYYELLDVNANANVKDIKAAYFKKIRIYPNETHPKEFEILTRAYKTLTDEKKRTAYDKKSNDNGNFDRLMEDALNEFRRNNYNRALSLFEEMRSLYPEELIIRQNIASCLIELGRYHQAKIILDEIYRDSQHEEFTLKLLSRLHFEQNQYIDAKKYIKELILVNPHEPDYYLRLSNIYFQLKDYIKAMEIIEKKLGQSEETIYDLPLILELYYLTIFAENHTYHKDVVTRLKQLPKTADEKLTFLNMMVDTCVEYGSENIGFKELISIIKEVNNSIFPNVTDWVKDAEASIDPRLVYYEESNPARVSSTTYTSLQNEKERGSLIISIVMGIIASIILTPLVGIIVGIVWYFYPGKIKAVLKGLGCLLIIIIILTILFNL